MTKKSKVILIILISFAVTGLAFTFPPIAQDPAYHNFADKRGLLGIPNFGDVMGNLFFMIFGFMGMRTVFKSRNDIKIFIMKREFILWELFFGGTLLVGFGSGYYHLEPNNHTLVWDRLPILAFACTL